MSPLRHIIRQLILEGAKERYMRMFENLPKEVSAAIEGRQAGDLIESRVDWARRILKKNDAIVWYLRWVRIAVFQIAIIWYLDGPGESHEIAAKLIEMQKKLAKKAGAGDHSHSTVSGWSANMVYSSRQTIEHYMSLDIPAINNYQYGRKTPYEWQEDMRAIEKEWKEKFDGLVPINEDDKVIMEFDGGEKAWVFLDRSECDIESKAMGHCGNAAGLESDRILSFRSRVQAKTGEEMWKPHLTFILDKNNQLGEMKGRGNDKPSPKYHKYIVALLQADELKFTKMRQRTMGDLVKMGIKLTGPDDPRLEQLQYEPIVRDITIKGIKGGGYLPENNFSLGDLDEEAKEELAEKKPWLLSIKEQYERTGRMNHDIASRIESVWTESGHHIKWSESYRGFLWENIYDYESAVDMLESLMARGDSLINARWWAKILDGEISIHGEHGDSPPHIVGDPSLEDVLWFYDRLSPNLKKAIQNYAKSKYGDSITVLHEKSDEIYWDMERATEVGMREGVVHENQKRFEYWLEKNRIVRDGTLSHYLIPNKKMVEITQEELDVGGYALVGHLKVPELNDFDPVYEGFDHKAAQEEFIENGILDKLKEYEPKRRDVTS